jgi:large repetitive protein
LPTRADCVLTETQTGGAISSVVTPNPADYVLLPNNRFELGDDLSVGTVDVTNTFAFSNFSLTKRVVGTDAGSNIDKTFTVELACELDVNGTMQPITIRDDAERSFKNGEVVTWEELPAGAECTVTETDNGGANAVSLAYLGAVMPGTTVTLASGDSTAVLSNTFLLALTGSEVLPWILVGGQLFLVGIVFMFVGNRKRRATELAAE